MTGTSMERFTQLRDEHTKGWFGLLLKLRISRTKPSFARSETIE